MAISIVLVALSPYGAFILRCLWSLLRGRPLPKVSKGKRQDAVEAIEGLERAAKAHITSLSERVSALRDEIDSLQRENEALRAHIREMEQGRTTSGATYEGSHGVPQNVRGAFIVLGLDGDPLPSWKDVQSAYRRAAMEHHPDQGGDADELLRVTKAMDVLRSFYVR